MRVVVALLIVALTGRAEAHGLEERLTAPGPMSIWDVLTIAVLCVVGLVYARGAWRIRARGAHQARREPIAFALGWLALLAAILPPLDALALDFFSAHMAQHELMMLVGAPLVIAGRPFSTCLWGLPDPWRTPAAGATQARPIGRTWSLLTMPVVAWALHGFAIWIWHAPSLYEWAIRNEPVHAVQHATFIATSALFWWGLLYGRYGRAGYGAAVFYVFTTAVHTGILGALVTFGGTPLYPIYEPRTAALGHSPLADQQIAGLLMWVPAGLVLTLMGVALFAAWLGEAERRARGPDQARTAAPAGRTVSKGLVIVLSIVYSASCGRNADNERVARELTGGDPATGAMTIHRYGCDACHTIPGILTATATVGPSLDRVGVRTYLAGRLENTPENLQRWIRQPHAVDERTAMPETGVTEQDARDIAAYLYTLR